MPRYSHLSVAVPLLAESENLPALLQQLRGQSFSHFTLYCCVNNTEGGPGLADNQHCLHLLRQVHDLPLVIIDRSSPGLGWQGKHRGVGWARKVLFDRIAADCDDNEVIVSLDADTTIHPHYLSTLLHTLNAHPDCAAFSVPYYHPLTGHEPTDRALLRYECYMRHYLIGLLRIGSPYAFTALGSAMAFPLWAYRRAGGITPLQGGEDFYLMQKLAKTGTLVSHFDSRDASLSVRPSARPSWRVPFGTGPAIAAGLEQMDLRYPFYRDEGFASVKATYDLFPTLYHHDVETPMSDFLRRQLATNDLWGPLRRNFRSPDRFIHACSERVDGLRILQYLKNTPAYRLPAEALPVQFHLDPIPHLDAYRNALLAEELRLRQ